MVLQARLKFSAILSVAAAFYFFPGLGAAQSAGEPAEVRQTYNFPFQAGNIAAPGNAAMVGNVFLRPDQMPSARYCGQCHEEAYSQWRQALHSNSFRTPFYRTSVNILARTRGIEFTRHCDSCHNPVAVLSGGMTPNSVIDRSSDEDGLTCMTCHSIQQVKSTEGNGGFVLGVPAVMVDEKGKPIPGEAPYGEIMAHPERHAQAVMRPLLHSPEFCAACHKANLPKELNQYKFVNAFATYDEWQNSKFSHRNPLSFYAAGFTTCQDCHMPHVPAPLRDYGRTKGMLASHRWTAGNTAVPFYYGFDDQLRKTVEFLQSGDFLNVDVFGIRQQSTQSLSAPLGSTSFTLAAGQTVQAYVVVQNKNIGHSLIPEVRDLYEAALEFDVVDAAGKQIYRSGNLNSDGSLDERSHSFTNKPVDTEGGFVDNHQVWKIHAVAFDNTIQAGRSVLVRYEFDIPPGARGPLTLTASVNYRHLRQSYLDNIFGKDHPAYPRIEIASCSRTLALGDNHPQPPVPRQNPDWMRWNNLGIAYLDQLQYPDAVAAFSEVAKLRPDYADGRTNVGLTYIAWEKYTEARPPLEAALKLAPGDARAMYYMALVERRAGNAEAEVADLESVVARFPQSRDARRELGISYYQQHRYQDAIGQFEALQAIDPDDLAAHYNLAVLYRRAGRKREAAEQAAMFSTEQVDPVAPASSLDFLRQHPEYSIESVPWHLHTNVPPAPDGGPGHP